MAERNRDTSAAIRTRVTKGHYKAHSAAATGIVNASESFTQEAFIARMGISRAQFNEMRRRGLIARKDGGRVRILGADYLEYLKNQPVAELRERPSREAVA